MTDHLELQRTLRVGDGPSWLGAIAEGDILRYRVVTPEGEDHHVELRVQRLVRRGAGVAAMLIPWQAPEGLRVHPHWVAGDDRSLCRLSTHPDLSDPGFVPLDPRGHVVRNSAEEAQWLLPAAWRSAEPQTDSSTWTVRELDLVLEGPVDMPRCTHTQERHGDERTRLTVCADLGVVEMTRGDDGAPQERWRLVRVERP